MQSFLTKIKTLFSSADIDKKTLDLLSTILLPLSELDSKYPERILNYILTAKDPYILQELQNLANDEAGALLSFPGTYSHYWGSHQNSFSTHTQRAMPKSIRARNKLYEDIFNTLSAEQIIRYSKFLVALTRKDNFTQITTLSPDWLTYLVVDGLVTTMRNRFKHSSERDNWSLSALQTLLEADAMFDGEDIDSTDTNTPKDTTTQASETHKVIIHLLFERKDVEEYYTDNLNEIYKLQDVESYLAPYQDYLQTLIPTLSAKGQSQFIKDFADLHPSFIKQMPLLVVTLSASDAKTVRQIAQAKLSLFDPESLLPYLQTLLQNGNAKQRRAIAEVIASEGARAEVNNSTENGTISDAYEQLLREALTSEKLKSVSAVIQSALSRLASVDEMEEESFEVAPFIALTSQTIPDSFIEVLKSNLQELLERERLSAEQEKQDNEAGKHTYKWRQDSYKDWLKIASKNYPKSIVQALNASHGKQSILRNQRAISICTYKDSLQRLPEFGLHHAVKLAMAHDSLNWYRLNSYITPTLLEGVELRQLEVVLTECGIKDASRDIANQYLQNYWSSELSRLMSTPEQVVPFFMENLDYLSEAMGLLPSKCEGYWRQFEPSRAISILIKFPFIPKLFIPKLLELALGENKNLRFEAQELLSRLPNVHERAIEALGNGKQAIRVTAVEWLARLNAQDDSHQAQILKALYALLKKEKKEVVIASLLTALEQMGEDISKYLSPSALLKDAEKGLKGKTLKSFEWFDLGGLPKLKWQNGKAVNPKIIQWWVTLAEKLKDPMPNGLLQRYLSLLDDKSQKALALHLLQSFINEDTRHPTLDEAMHIAQKEAPGRLQMYQDYFDRFGKKDPDSWAYRYGSMTLNDVIEEIKKERLSVYIGSAIKSKGLLALTFKAEGNHAVAIVQDFMKNHYRRTSQIIAILTALSVSDDPLIIQLLLGISRRYRTRSIQELAKNLVAQIAERNNWTADELADRTIPTAGLDDDGVLTLDYGSRTLTAYVNDKDKFVLQNETGKVIKSLPAPRQNDDKAVIKDAKSLFSSSKKELKQVLQLQTARLYEAMCSERVWSSADWQEYLFAHPVMKRLITRLIWLEVEVDDKGNKRVVGSFRPSDDGALLDFNDEEIRLQDNSFIKLAHVVLLSEDDTELWREHLKDYEIKPLFSQLEHTLPTFKGSVQVNNESLNNEEQIDEFKGYVTDTFTLRGVLTKLGYQRASIEDAGSFDRYFKNYDSLGMSSVIVFSGSYVPEENIPAVLFELCFEKERSTTWNSDYIALKDVPPVLLAESYAEYKKVAEATAGFDADWEKKTPW